MKSAQFSVACEMIVMRPDASSGARLRKVSVVKNQLLFSGQRRLATCINDNYDDDDDDADSTGFSADLILRFSSVVIAFHHILYCDKNNAHFYHLARTVL